MFLPLSCFHVPKEQPQPSTFLPGPRTGLSSRLLQLRKLLWKEEETLAVAGGGLVLAWGAFSGLVWAQQCMLALGFFGTCEVPKAWVETLLCHQVFLAVPGAFTAS